MWSPSLEYKLILLLVSLVGNCDLLEGCIVGGDGGCMRRRGLLARRSQWWLIGVVVVGGNMDGRGHTGLWWWGLVVGRRRTRWRRSHISVGIIIIIIIIIIIRTYSGSCCTVGVGAWQLFTSWFWWHGTVTTPTTHSIIVGWRRITGIMTITILSGVFTWAIVIIVLTVIVESSS